MFSISLQVEHHALLKGAYSFDKIEGSDLYDVYKWYCNWVVSECGYRGVPSALVDYLKIDDVIIVKDFIWRMNSQSFRKQRDNENVK